MLCWANNKPPHKHGQTVSSDWKNRETSNIDYVAETETLKILPSECTRLDNAFFHEEPPKAN
jgi:hypothetical protein